MAAVKGCTSSTAPSTSERSPSTRAGTHRPEPIRFKSAAACSLPPQPVMSSSPERERQQGENGVRPGEQEDPAGAQRHSGGEIAARHALLFVAQEIARAAQQAGHNQHGAECIADHAPGKLRPPQQDGAQHHIKNGEQRKIGENAFFLHERSPFPFF